MKTITETEAETSLQQVLDASRHDGVSITRKGKPVAVLMSQAEYARLEELEDAVWAARADEIVANEKSLGPEETGRTIRELLARANP